MGRKVQVKICLMSAAEKRSLQKSSADSDRAGLFFSGPDILVFSRFRLGKFSLAFLLNDDSALNLRVKRILIGVGARNAESKSKGGKSSRA